MMSGDFYKCEKIGKNLYARIIAKLDTNSYYNWLYCSVNLDTMEFIKDRRNMETFTEGMEKIYDENEIARLEKIYQENKDNIIEFVSGSSNVDIYSLGNNLYPVTKLELTKHRKEILSKI